ncbi:MAG: prepilin-type N-terminal cleavage/methylation domain-containing protein [Candidatus Spechtbacterales bacterium]
MKKVHRKNLQPITYNLTPREGFTLLELIMVLAIAGIFLAISAGVYYSLQQSNVLVNESRKALSAVRLAQNKTLAARNFSQHGVYFDQDNNSIVMFEGSEYDSGNANNEIIDLDGRVEISNIQIDGSTSTTVFNRVLGSTDNFGFIEFSQRNEDDNRAVLCIQKEGSLFLSLETDENFGCVEPDIDHVAGGGDDNIVFFPDDLAQGDPAQSFTLGDEDINVSKAELYLRYNDSDSNSEFSDLYLEIREDSTVGNVLGYSRIVRGSGIPSTVLSWSRFVFPSPVELEANTQYFMRLRSLPNSNDSGSGAEPAVIWGYDGAGGYAGGSAWRHIGANSNSADTGEQMTGTDLKFKLYATEAPPFMDSRHMEFNVGTSLNDYSEIILEFEGGSVTEAITISEFMNASLTEFEWEGEVEVNLEPQMLKIHSLYIDGNDTILSVHRDRRHNNASLTIYLDTEELVSYTAEGAATKGININSMVYR